MDISIECSNVRKACFPKELQGSRANRVGAVIFGQAVLAGILHFTNVFEGLLGSGFVLARVVVQLLRILSAFHVHEDGRRAATPLGRDATGLPLT